MKKYYQLLGIDNNATIEAIEQAYQRQIEELQSLQGDDEAYIRAKQERLREAYYAVLLFRETRQVLPDYVARDAEAIEQMLIKARLEKSERPKSAKVKGKNKGNWMVGFALIAVILIIAELIPVERFEPEQYVYLHQYEQAEEKDLHIGEVAEASKKYIQAYAAHHPREYAPGGTGRYELRKTEKWEQQFLETYWGYESFGEVTDYLCDTYDGYICDSSYDVGIEDAVYTFYGFLPYNDIIGYRNPFTGELIERTYQIYLYYIQFYEAYENEAL